MIRYIQLLFDVYQPNVEGQIIRDIIAMKNAYPRDQFVAVCHSYAPESVLRTLGVDRIPEYDGKLEVTLVYKTTEFWPEHPSEETNVVVMRDLERKKTAQGLTTDNQGYYLKPKGWGIRETIDLNRRGPVGVADPMVKVLWGAFDGDK